MRCQGRDRENRGLVCTPDSTLVEEKAGWSSQEGKGVSGEGALIFGAMAKYKNEEKRWRKYQRLVRLHANTLTIAKKLSCKSDANIHRFPHLSEKLSTEQTAAIWAALPSCEVSSGGADTCRVSLGFREEAAISLICAVYPPSASFISFSQLLRKVMCRVQQSRDLRSGRGSIHCSPTRSRQRSGLGFRIQHLWEQTHARMSGVASRASTLTFIWGRRIKKHEICYLQSVRFSAMLGTLFTNSLKHTKYIKI